MAKWNHSEDSLGLSFESGIFECSAHSTLSAVFGGIVDGVFVQRHNMGSTEFTVFIRVTRGVCCIEAQEEQVVVLDQFINIMLDSSQVMVTIRQLHAIRLQRIGP